MKYYNLFNQLIISILGTFILLITSHPVIGQVFDASQNPPSVKFKQINTPSFQIIYPTLLEAEAQRMANTLDAIIKDVSKSLGHQPKPISIILQTQGVVSNGFVQMAPRRSEFYTIPGQEFDSQDWLNSLAVHEMRHVVQFDKLSPKLSAPLFEELKLALFGINLPPWFFEGDAVGIETALTNAGRGRQPSFDMVLRANELSKNHFSYSKNYFGSLKSYTAGYYPLGYLMTTKIRRDGGPKILDNILERIHQLPIRPYNFSSSLKKFSGIGTHQLYVNTLSEMDSLWSDQLAKSATKDYEILNSKQSKIPTSYLLPFSTEDGGIICIKGSKAKTPAITLIKNGQEIGLVKIGYQTEPNLNYAANKVVWDEYRSDPRFDQRSFNVICIYDLQTKKYSQLTSKTRLFSPALSPDGKKIIAVKVSAEGIFNLIELNTETGEEIKSFPNPQNFTLQFPSYNSAGDKIVVAAVNEQGKTILLYDCNNETQEQLLTQIHQIIAKPIFYQNKIIFKAHYNGIDNIYAFNLQDKKISQLSFAKFGAFNPSVNSNGILLFNNYLPQGYQISSIDLNKTDAFNSKPASSLFVEYFKPLISQENRSNVFVDIPTKTYESKSYKDINHLFYFHSIEPIYESNAFNNGNNFGFDLVSNNKLNTLSSYIGYRFNNALNKNEYRAGFSYLKYYPQLSLDYENRTRLSYTPKINGTDTSFVAFQWRENVTSFKINLPFYTNWLNKSFYSGLSIESSYTNRYQFSLQPTDFLKTVKFPLKYKFIFGLNSQRSPRDLAPLWGQNIQLSYEHLPFIKNRNGQYFAFESQFYFPGLFLNHSFQSSLNFQTGNGIYATNIAIVRASGYANLAPIAKLYNTLLLDYRFPIAYPDWEIGPLAYVKRIRGGFFTDFENIGKGKGLRSYGAELKTDMNLLRFYLPNFVLGGKIIFPNESNIKKPIFELGLNFSL
ncbi:MAG: hypothetical protein KKG25_16120 [Bacteroidetes bacterium]|nr:hypothetical protein [Bacteroidota bacterium]MBU1486378.1 hypothetical protein [Bacteroidota bacterium]MBU1761628.1 hypothetical protein [Bacteroidota bacterium]MBU2376682.1 hypothetical protein [Bacteroidota bacterium]